jgi:hypothetical protein
MLDSHERLAVPQETGVMRLVTAHRWVPWWAFGSQWHHRLGLTDEDLDRALADFYGGLFAQHAARQGKVRWGDKTPFHVWHVDDILRLFPSAVFIAIVRHPLGAIGSMVRRFDKKLPRAIRHWLGANREIVRQAAAHGDRMCVVRYEDLIRDPETTMRELVEWLGEPWSPAVLKHHEVQRGKNAPAVVEGGTRSTEPVDTDRVDRWRKWFSEDDRRLIDSKTAEWARFFGYDADPSGSVEPLAVAASDRRHVATGVELSARRRAFPDLDWSPPPRPRGDDPILPRSLRRRRRATRGPTGPAGEAARQVLEHLPPSAQRAIRDARRSRRSRGAD